MQGAKALALAAAAALSVGPVTPAKAAYPNCHKGVRGDTVRGFASTANGGQSIWVIRSMDAAYWSEIGGHANFTIWVGANGQDTNTTWVELGTLKGAQYYDGVNHWTYYTVRGINGGSTYNAVNLSGPGSPPLNTTREFDAFYSGTSFQVDIEYASNYYWPTVTGPTIEYATGFEATCATSDDREDRVDRTYVSKMRSHRVSDGAWIQSDHGSLFNNGSSAGGADWCQAPFTFKAYLHSASGISSCS